MPDADIEKEIKMITASLPPTATNEDIEITSHCDPEGNWVTLTMHAMPVTTISDKEAQILSRLVSHLALRCGKLAFTAVSGDVIDLTRLPEGLVFGVKDGLTGKEGQRLFSANESLELAERLLEETFRPLSN